MNVIVKNNLKRMEGGQPGDMPLVLISESMGGNAGHWRGQPCVGANFHYVAHSGEIKYFGNLQDVPRDIRDYPIDTFRVVMGGPWERNVVNYSPPSKASDIARSNLETTVKLYNQRKHFSP